MASVTSHSWICCQIGAREHYAVPRSLLRANQAVELLTDVWASPSRKSLLPARWRQRFHTELSDMPVHAWTASAAWLQARLRLKRCSLWEQNIQTNAWFQKKVCRLLPSLVRRHRKPPVVFAYSYAASKIFEVAKELGCLTILGQIDPGPVEMRIVQELERQQGAFLSEWPPESYWEQWRVECSLADRIVVNSEWSRTALLKEAISDFRIAVIPLAFDARSVRRRHCTVPDQFSAARPLRVLFLGQVIARKGIHELAGAIQRMQHLPVHWNIIGGGPSAILNQLRNLPHTTVTGSVSRESASRLYSQADVFILPTYSDGFALTQLEALAHGVPVIATPFCGDVVRDGQNGMLLTHASEHAIVTAVETLVESPSLLHHLQSAAFVESRFSLDAIGRQFVELGELSASRASSRLL